MKLTPGIYAAGYQRPFFVSQDMVRAHLEGLGATDVVFHARKDNHPFPAGIDPKSDPAYMDTWDEWVTCTYLGAEKEVEEPIRWQWLAHAPLPGGKGEPGGFRVVPATKTPIGREDAARALLAAWPELDREQAALFLALMWIETAQGHSAVQFNPGNLSASETTWHGKAWRPPWYELTGPNPEPRLVKLHELMLQGKAPKAFRAYDTWEAGFRDWASNLKSSGYAPLREAASSGDVARFVAELGRRYAADYTSAHVKGLTQFRDSFRPLVIMQPAPKPTSSGFDLSKIDPMTILLVASRFVKW